MGTIVLVVHVLAAIAIIGLVLIQQGKGADAGASFGGGASQTVFGSQGGSSFFGRLTALFALVFFLTSFALAYVASNKAKEISGQVNSIPTVQESTDANFPDANETAPAVSESNSADDSAADSDIPVVE